MTGEREPVEWFEPAGGRVVGALGLVFLVILSVVAVADGLQGKDVTAVGGFAFGAAVIWVVLFRPRVGLTSETLVLRRPITRVSLPLAAIEQVALRQVLAVLVGEERYVATGLGRSRRALNRKPKKESKPSTPVPDYTAFVEERLAQRMEDARSRAGVGMLSDEQLALAAGVRREWAWPEIAALTLTGLVFAAGLIS